jgi:predicted ABC-type exoprotein transport system permease subunit
MLVSDPRKALLYGFLIWLFVFGVAFVIFPLREMWRSLFESIMPVAIVLATTAFSHLYLKDRNERVIREAVIVGFVWLAVNLAVDIPLMMTGPMQMPLVEYMADIGVTYLMIPAIAISMGIARSTALKVESRQ